MDLSLIRVLEALLPGPCTPGILATRYGMGVEEAVEALAEAVDQGYARELGPGGYELTGEGRLLARGSVRGDRQDRAGTIAGGLRRRDLALRRFDP